MRRTEGDDLAVTEKPTPSFANTEGFVLKHLQQLSTSTVQKLDRKASDFGINSKVLKRFAKNFLKSPLKNMNHI